MGAYKRSGRQGRFVALTQRGLWIGAAAIFFLEPDSVDLNIPLRRKRKGGHGQCGGEDGDETHDEGIGLHL